MSLFNSTPSADFAMLFVCLLVIACMLSPVVVAQTYYDAYYYDDGGVTIQNQNVNSQLANTGFLSAFGAFCLKGNNSYSFILLNGFTTLIDATVTLDCEGCAPSYITARIDPLSRSGVLGISPPGASCPIANRMCTLTMTLPNPYAVRPLTPGAPLVAAQVTSSCGAPPINQYTRGCIYWATNCRFSNGEWYRNAPCILIFIAIYFLVMGGLTVVYLVIYETSTTRRHNLIDSTRRGKLKALPDADQNEFGAAAKVGFRTGTAAPANNTPASFAYTRGQSSASSAVATPKANSATAGPLVVVSNPHKR